MNDRVVFFRRSLLAGGVLCFVVALVVAAAVIPQVKAEVLRDGTPQKAVNAFWVNAGFGFLSAVSLLYMALKSGVQGRTSKSARVLIGFIVMILGLALADAASAYQSHGPQMQTASALLFICAAADLLGVVMIVASFFLQPKKE